MCKEEVGVTFRLDDYAKLWQRILADVVDVSFLFLSLVLAVAVLPEELTERVTILWIGFCAFYLVVLKATSLRTIGYRVMKLRLIKLTGKPATVWSCTVRTLFAVIGPLNYGLDLLWIPGDPARQALRDKFAETLVIRESAQPAKTGRIRYRRFHFLGWTFLFSEVDHEAENAPVIAGA